MLDAVKGYMTHERSLLEEMTALRTRAQGGRGLLVSVPNPCVDSGCHARCRGGLVEMRNDDQRLTQGDIQWGLGQQRGQTTPLRHTRSLRRPLPGAACDGSDTLRARVGKCE